MADSSIGGNGDLQLQQLLINSQQQQQQSVNNAVDDGESEAARKAAEKRLFLKQQSIKISTEASTDERVSLHENQATYNEAYSGRLGADVQQLMSNPQMQQKLTAAQKRMFLESLQQDTPKAQQAAAAFNRLSAAPAFAQAVPTAQGVGEVFSMVMQNPRLEGSIQKALQSDFMQSPRADVTTKTAFLRFGTQNTARDPMRSIQAAGDMLGSLSKTRTPVSAQRSAMAMVQREPNNVDGMKNVDAFVQVPTIRTMPSMARGFATTTLAKADGDVTVRQGLEAISQNPAFSGLTGRNKAQVFATINLGRTSDLRVVTDQMLRTFETPGFGNLRQGQLTVLFQQMGQQVRSNKVSSEDSAQPPATLVRQAKKSGMPAMPTLISMASIDPEDEELLTQARAQNRSKIIQYYNQVSGNYDEVEGQLGRAKYIEDLHLNKGLRQSEALDLTALDVSPEFSEHIDARLENLKQKSESRQISRGDYAEQLKNFSQTIAQQIGRPLTTDESTYVFAQQRQAQADNSFGSLTRQKGLRMRELRGQRMPPKKRRQQAADQRPAAQPRYFSPNAGSQRQAFALPLPGQAQSQGPQGKNSLPQQQSATAFSPRGAAQGMPGAQNGMPQMPRPMGHVASGGRASGTPRGATNLEGMPQKGQGQRLSAASASAMGLLDAEGLSVEQEVAQIVQKLDPNLPAAKKIEQAKKMLLQRHVALATQVIEALTQDVGQLEVLQPKSQPRKGRQQQGVNEQVSAPGSSPAEEAFEATTPSARLTEKQPLQSREARTQSQEARLQGPDSDKTLGSTTAPQTLAPVERIGQKPRGSAQALVDRALQNQPDALLPQGGNAQTRPAASQFAQPAFAVEPQASSQSPRDEKTDVQPLDAGVLPLADQQRINAQTLNAVEKIGGQRPRGAAAALAQRVTQQSGLDESTVPSFAAEAFVPAESTEPAVYRPESTETTTRTTQGKTDAWGIQRTFERDLGASTGAQTRGSRAFDTAADFSQSQNLAPEPLEKYTGRALVKTNAQIRDVATLYNVAWKNMSRAELALVRNLGWTQQMWDTKFEASARWPTSMRTSYERLSPKQRESVRLLGLSAADWDAYVEGNDASGSMGNPNKR